MILAFVAGAWTVWCYLGALRLREYARERRVLMRFASVYNVAPRRFESNASIRARCVQVAWLGK